MFALRTIIGNRQYNKALGHEYQIIERDVEYDAFCDFFEETFGYSHVADLDDNADNYTKDCYAFVITQGFKPIPLYKKQLNYVMTESGKTFSNLTRKELN